MRSITILVYLLFSVAMLSGQTFYVAAPSGLKLRKTANAKGDVVKAMPYGTKLISVADTKSKVAHKTKEAEGFYLNGYWQKVAAGKDTGYVFDAFLLPFEPFSYGDFEHLANTVDLDTTADHEIPVQVHLLESRYGKGSKLFDIVKYNPNEGINIRNKQSPYAVKSFKQTFASNNIVLTYYTQGIDGGNLLLTFKNYPLSYVYAFALSYARSTDYENMVTATLYLDDTIIIPTGTCSYEIKVKANSITLKQHCGC